MFILALLAGIGFFWTNGEKESSNTQPEAAGIWCSIQNADKKTCYFYNQEGTIFNRAPQTSRGFLLFLIEDMRHGQAGVGEKVLKDRMQQYIENLTNTLAREVAKPGLLRIVNDEEVRVVLQEGWTAYFSSAYDPKVQARDLALILEKEIKDKRPLLDYVDLRLKDKVFYKLKET